ncbi:TetR/AcrR family transcriptional regulator [Ruegeria sp. HKCCD8929]|uniref:TetR/AcrR family transcriptional regulator n=1 Tax=Ruegeria sp. HKCCD8929 TaxID=2683006 RepID=UPI001489BE9A|nr:TetR/AcrR family transcriptional regulator [Ruegeria sp. HKCCD8929]
MKDLDVDPKQKAILMSAWQAFAAYGFRKTSMDDIARGAGMSRPAVYLHYKNKEAIFRSLAQHYYDMAAADVAEALGGEGTIRDLIARAFSAQGGDVMAAMLSSPHGMELLDASNATSSDISDAGEARLRDLYADWLEREAAQGRVRLTGEAQDVAATITAALKGIKAAVPSYDDYTTRVAQLAALIGAGLEVR